jgi:hypothetical protein
MYEETGGGQGNPYDESYEGSNPYNTGYDQ